ncbi:MAG: glycoside hydrolase family 88 protein [Bacteroidota bacterium]
MKTKILLVFLLINSKSLYAQSYGEKMAASCVRTWTDSINLRPGNAMHWTYDRGVILKGFEYLWYNSGNPFYYNTIKKSMDAFVDNEGTIKGYSLDEYNIDHVLCGRSLLTLYKVTGEIKYYKAATLLRKQLLTHPRTKEGGFWHKKRYDWQMWLDGLYMGQPFYAEYAATFHEDTAFNDIANQFVWMENHARDNKTGLLYHGWDESKEQRWADKTTGLSPHFWGRAMGWYGMALVDALQYFPESHPRKKELVAILQRFATAVVNVQDKETGLWWDIMDKPHYKNNYPEASASCMLVYTLAKGVRNSWLPATFLPAATKGYDGIIKKFISTDAAGNINLEGTVSVSGLGGNPDSYRDGSFEYYMSEKVIQNDPKGVGAFLKCASEIEMLPTLKKGAGKKVAVDYYFNQEKRKDITGKEMPYHYIWDEMDNNGFSLLGHTFNKYGVQTSLLDEAPNAVNLADKQFYIIVDPDNKKDNPSPNYITNETATAVYNWVNNGGILVLLANDSTNCDLEHFNLLADKFGLHFTNKSVNMVKGQEYETGAVLIPASNEVFSATKKVYLKEVSTLAVKTPAVVVAAKSGDTIIAISKVGKGAVFAAGDPWLYNEYTDGRKIPAEYQNFSAANELIEWMIKKSSYQKKK